MDLVDERLGVYRLADGSFISHTWELEQSGVLTATTDEFEHIAFGTDKHFKLWSAAAREVIKVIQSLKLPIVVLAPAWAGVSDAGDKNVSYRNKSAKQWNKEFARYHAFLVSLKVDVIVTPEKLSVAGANHQWGLAPYHFIDDTYEYMQQGIKDSFNRGADNRGLFKKLFRRR